ncbi:tRNA lysidine(34) synthetase TilS [Kytococcus sp. Marseille-QA3725]
MPGPPPAVAAVRRAVRGLLAEAVAAGRPVLLACSGGPDSTAMAAAVAFEADGLRRRGVDPLVAAVVVDHGLQDGSDRVAARAVDTLWALGIGRVESVRVQVVDAGEGPEAAARRARHAALERCADALTPEGTEATRQAETWLAHTRDDQAEQVLLGLVRGAGTRSLAGMSPHRGRLRRPLLGLPAVTTRRACEDLGLDVHHDPHNEDPRFTRVRARWLLQRLATELGTDLAPALARTADHARADADLLDALARERLEGLPATPDGTCPVDDLLAVEEALRPRVWRQLVLRAAGPDAPAPAAVHLRELDRLLTDWTGQGPVDLPGPRRWWRWRGPGGAAVVGPISDNDPAPQGTTPTHTQPGGPRGR